ncbi:hypothetical protein SADUNF_Sadunf01G0022800 [Salix dunnii]|uniref:RING-type domain-containing protein n=1 Tax=Salix dunnii TaxID=1413687 RepID=A0A835TIT3_9ROSI|nr:hypothetical protein SADUNF_Sadunf01G0022800 [Salix dunnii]
MFLNQELSTTQVIGESVNVPAQTALKPNVTVSSSVRELLECPVCLNVMYRPVHHVQMVNTLCSSCKPRVQNRCPICRHELGNIRCLALEKVAAFLELPCTHQIEFWCTAIGDIPYLVAHLKDEHKVDVHNGSTFNTDMSNQIHMKLYSYLQSSLLTPYLWKTGHLSINDTCERNCPLVEVKRVSSPLPVLLT